MWCWVRENANGKSLSRVYEVVNGMARHRKATVPIDELMFRCTNVNTAENPLDLVFAHYVVCFKKPCDAAQEYFEVRICPIGSRVNCKGMVRSTGELCTLGEFMKEFGYTISDVVGVWTEQEFNTMRRFQRMRA